MTDNMNKNEQRIVNIIGMSPNNLWLPEHGERWGINHAIANTSRLDKWFVMDGVKAMYDHCDKVGLSVKDLFDFMENNPDMELISAFPEKFVWNNEVKAVCQKYPIKEVNALLPGVFANSSITMAIAYACVQEELGLQKVDQINLYGIEMWAAAEHDEYHYQKDCMNFWIAFCYGKGIKVSVPAFMLYAKDTKHNLYGFYREDMPQI